MDDRLNVYVKHAKKYGTEGVLEAARDTGFGHQHLCDLLRKLDEIDADNARARRFDRPVKHRLTIEERVNRLLGIDTNGEGQ